jgi:F420-non-reducing hydrogenase iron-sulfur subunit
MKSYKPKIIAFACHWCGVGKNEITAVEDFSDFKLIKLMCSGRVNSSLVLKTFSKGADGIIVFGCEKGKCHYNFGNENAIKESETIVKMMELLGIESERFRLELGFFNEKEKLNSVVKEFVKGLKKLGPGPMAVSSSVGQKEKNI